MGRNDKRHWTSCRVKKVHYNFLTVIQHCVSLQREEPVADIHVYKCDFCEGMHISSGSKGLKNPVKIRKSLKQNLKIMAHPNFWEKAPQEVISHHIQVEIELVKKMLNLKPLYVDRTNSIPRYVYFKGESNEATFSGRNNLNFLSQLTSFLSLKFLSLLRLFNRTFISSREDSGSTTKEVCNGTANSGSGQEDR